MLSDKVDKQISVIEQWIVDRRATYEWEQDVDWVLLALDALDMQLYFIRLRCKSFNQMDALTGESHLYAMALSLKVVVEC